jgi:YgiT-type zinc finger domain-containing protein
MKKERSSYHYGERHVCGEQVEERRINQRFWIKDKLILVEDIPAEVRVQCGEKVVNTNVRAYPNNLSRACPRAKIPSPAAQRLATSLPKGAAQAKPSGGWVPHCGATRVRVIRIGSKHPSYSVYLRRSLTTLQHCSQFSFLPVHMDRFTPGDFMVVAK